MTVIAGVLHTDLPYSYLTRTRRVSGMSIPGIDEISRTKLRGVLALLKTVGCLVCSKESHEDSFTTMGVSRQCFMT